jgi:hypothetical protein
MMAREWGIPPWQVEAEASAEWVDRWKMLGRQTQRIGRQQPTRPGTVRL